MEVTGSSGTSVPTLKVTCVASQKRAVLFAKLPPPFDVPGVVALLPFEGELSRSFTLLQDRTAPHLPFNVSAFLMSDSLDVADDV